MRLRGNFRGTRTRWPPTLRFNPEEAEVLFTGCAHTYKELYAESAVAYVPLGARSGIAEVHHARNGIR